MYRRKNLNAKTAIVCLLPLCKKKKNTRAFIKRTIAMMLHIYELDAGIMREDMTARKIKCIRDFLINKSSRET